ncbi:MAG: hypothetical protein WBM86_04335 [Waterburya sp.]
MPSESMLENLDDKEILGILSEITIELREGLSDEDKKNIQSEDEARLAIAALLKNAGENVGQIAPEIIIPEDSDVKTAARGVLGILVNDPEISSEVEDLIENPPEESQLSGVEVATTAIILGALISWLQTKVKIQVSLKDGQLDFSFELIKESTDTSIIKEVVKSIKTLLGIPSD